MAILPLLLLVPALLSFLFTFGTGVELIRFVSLRALFVQQPAGAAAPQHRAGASSCGERERERRGLGRGKSAFKVVSGATSEVPPPRLKHYYAFR